jgi:hypothetical protein
MRANSNSGRHGRKACSREALPSAMIAQWTRCGKARRSGEQADGSRRAGIFVGAAEASWFGGAPGAYVAYPDTKSGEEVAIVRVIPRDDDE